MPRQLLDLTGEKHGRLTVIKEAPRSGYTRRWECMCDCGNPNAVIVTQPNLRNGHTLSCGCFQREMASESNGVELTGRRFGRWTVLKRAGKSNNRKIMWLCQCVCGEERPVLSNRLLSGESTSCGCSRTDSIAHARKVLREQFTVNGVPLPKLEQKVRSDNKSGLKGISLRKTSDGQKRYMVRITVKGKHVHLGTYKTVDLARKARKVGEQLYHYPYLRLKKRPKRRQSVERECTLCGTDFMGGHRAKFCPKCKSLMNAEYVRQHLNRAAKGLARRIGMTYSCDRCDADFILKTATQKFCENCHDHLYQNGRRAYSHEFYELNKSRILINHRRREQKKRKKDDHGE
ncbi:hypothetical protein BN871_AT_00690 [Paenibacillus sp. P22]|nr:hypothetical protein BN871_AT_00690 [Paenibacillus sp. P22]